MQGKSENAILVVNSKRGTEQMIVFKDKLQTGVDLNKYTESVGNWNSKNLADYKEESIERYTLSGVPALLRIYTCTSADENKTPLKVMEAYTLKESYGFTILCSSELQAYNTFAPVFKKMIDSFQFIEALKTVTPPVGMDVTGVYQERYKNNLTGETGYLYITLVQRGKEIRGQIEILDEGSGNISGTISENIVNFSAEVKTYYGNFYLDFKGTVEGENISGTYLVRGEMVNGIFTLTKEF